MDLVDAGPVVPPMNPDRFVVEHVDHPELTSIALAGGAMRRRACRKHRHLVLLAIRHLEEHAHGAAEVFVSVQDEIHPHASQLPKKVPAL